nr:NADP-dependent oxidoreductase [Kibdelosporangium sp. MJ126-NF4]CEL14495.1 Zinc-containing alcohol dehydrogenase superfamily [Kibdelosporangium sp. MJ126-NF4]CTQ88860.1 Zinc-containing alcohol dehydrogenase superfamily [Kibdelosporangium sp. MJ126-NF4]
MKAARIHSHGDPSVIRIDEIGVPVPSDGETLVTVAATSFNPTEIAVRRGVFDIALPRTLGWDLAGEADGEPVIGFVDSGAAAEFAAAPLDRLVPAPTSIPLAHAAAIPLAGLTAWQTVSRIERGQKVLINGAGGGIGGFAVQLAKHWGAYVIATASPRSAAAVRAYGADEVVDYTQAAPDQPVDVMIHLVGTPPPWPVPAREQVISAAAPVEADVPSTHVVMRYDRDHLSALVALIDAGVITVDVTASYPLAAMAEVHRRGEAGEFRGKVTVVTR